MKKYHLVLKYASEDRRNDRDIVLFAVKNNPEAFRYASDRLRSNLKFILQLITIDIEIILYLSVQLKNDKTVQIRALRESAYVLAYLDDDVIIARELLQESKLTNVNEQRLND